MQPMTIACWPPGQPFHTKSAANARLASARSYRFRSIDDIARR
jgi:hypothetical protein